MKPLQEPLFHFVIAGAVLFGAYALLSRGEDSAAANKPNQIRIGQGEVQWLSETWMLQRQREPTHEELRGLVAEFLNEELLAREAREMKLDESDTIVRRRLAQKLNFLIEGTLRRSEPAEADLQRIYETHPERFRTGARVSFTHVYFNPAQRNDTVSDANNALADLSRSGRGPTEPMGDRFLLPSEFREESEQTVTGAFGPEFARTLFALKPEVWSGPIASGYGVHLVRVSALRHEQLRPFSDVRAQLLEEWRYDQEKTAKARYLTELRKKYDVVMDDSVKPLLAPAVKTTESAR
jgi:plasmid stabilization system protein ParE